MLGISDERVIGVAISQIVKKKHFAKTLSNLLIVKYSGNSTEIDGIAIKLVKSSANATLSFELFNLNRNQRTYRDPYMNKKQ